MAGRRTAMRTLVQCRSAASRTWRTACPQASSSSSSSSSASASAAASPLVSQRRWQSSQSSPTPATAQMDLGRHFYLNKVLEQYAAKPATRMTLRQLVFFGRTLGRDRDKILKSANYVRQELAVRIAHRIRDLQALPFVVMTNAHLEEVYEKYWTAFETFRKIPMIRTLEDNEAFCATLKRLLDDHLTIIPSLTIGIVESSHHLPPEQLDGFMERMLRSRISRRVLAEQHIALSDALDDPFHFFNDVASTPTSANSDGDHIGIIYTNLKVANVIHKVIRLLTNIFQDEVHAGVRTGDAAVIPDVVIDGALETRFAYIPEHLEYIFFELLKNSMMAVMRQPLSARDPVTIRVTIVEGPPDEDLIVRVSDCGGGLPDLLAKLNAPQHVRREHRRKHRSAISRKRREVLDEESASISHPTPAQQSGDGSSGATGKTPLSAVMVQQDGDSNVTMDSTLGDDQRSSLASAIEMGTALDIDNETLPRDTKSNVSGEVDLAILPAALGNIATPSGASAIRAGVHDQLIAAVTSFSNVRRRLEIEEEQIRQKSPRSSAVSRKVGPSINETAASNAKDELPQHEQHVSTSLSSSRSEEVGVGKEATDSLAAAAIEARDTGLDSRAKLEALRNVGRFKGTVAEQLRSYDDRAANERGRAFIAATPSTAQNMMRSMASTMSGSDDLRNTFTRHETGLGLPMTKIYTDFFGGSLSLRSLDGHGMDVYVRLPKLGTNKEAIEEIVL